MKIKFVLKYIYYSYIITSVLFALLFISSCKIATMSDADKRFGQGEYYEAASIYNKVYKKLPKKDAALRGIVAFRMGECYRLINNVSAANRAYMNALRINPQDSIVKLQYARVLHATGNYKQAALQYSEFLKSFTDNEFAKNGLAGTELAPQLKANPTRYTVAKMHLFNSTRGEFSPMLLSPDYDMVYFATHRETVLGETKSAITGFKNNDIFVARKDENNKWLRPESAGGVNTDFDEGTPSFSASGNTMYYTFCDENTEKNATALIYKSSRLGGEWSKGSRLDLTTDSTMMAAHPAISPSGNYLYFVSDRLGGYGGKDIWRAAFQGDEIGYIENLGAEINTAGDEMFPYVRNDTTLYFASDGHPGMGGLDLFKATLSMKNQKWRIENMGFPINSQGDDFGITFAGEKESGFFSSNRGDIRGEDHIYSFDYPIVKVAVEGFIVDKEDEFVKNATIRVVGNDGTNEKFQGKPDGTYRLHVNRGVNYVLLANGEGYLNSKMELKTVPTEKDSIYYVDFVLYSISKPSVLENIFYDFDKAALRDESKKELNELIELLELNPNVTIELSAHTDRKGTQDYNQKLSQRRAQSVVDYLISHRVAKDRLTVAGYGKLQPKVVTKSLAKKHDFLKEGDVLTEDFVKLLAPDQQEIADQINRRTEFKVLSVTYGLR